MEPLAQQGELKDVKEKSEHAKAMVEKTRERASSAMHHHPVMTVGSACALGLMAALTVGAGPAVVAGGAAWLTWRWLKRTPGPLYSPPESGERDSFA
jgi:hypothetical protein